MRRFLKKANWNSVRVTFLSGKVKYSERRPKKRVESEYGYSL